MKATKLNKEEQEAHLQTKAKKSLETKKKKPSFSEWLMHDKTAFKVTLLIGAIGGVIVMALLLALSFMFNFDILFKILFGVLLILQSWNAYKLIKNQKHMETSINDMVFKGKHNKTDYEYKKGLYDKTKEEATA